MRNPIVLIIIAVFVVLQGNAQELPKVKIVTTLGNIIVEVDTIKAPVSALNFLKLVEEGSYENGVFYRVVRLDNQPENEIKIEVIQGGVLSEDRLESIAAITHETTRETGIKHLDGTISMARMEPGTASSEFFICIGNQPELDFGGKRNPDGQGFAAFGQLIQGMDVVRKIQTQQEKGQILIEKIAFSISRNTKKGGK